MSEVLTTERLELRPFSPEDAEAFQRLAGDWDVARMTSDIPHPLGFDQALRWLEPAEDEHRFAILRHGTLIGGAGYFLRPSGVAELGFWLGHEYWGQGYATEATRAVLAHGFTQSRYPTFSSSHFVDNPASKRVLEKLGFEPAGFGRIWSSARGTDVEAALYWLTRARAAMFLDLPPEAERPGRLGALLSRIAGTFF
ncbi:MAG: GNAT family N-acetyltransferase [Hyphomicrobiaceae bacterium]